LARAGQIHAVRIFAICLVGAVGIELTFKRLFNYIQVGE
jgi:hypothetical protein